MVVPVVAVLERDGNQPPPVALTARHERTSRGFRVAGLEADTALQGPEQFVMVLHSPSGQRDGFRRRNAA